MKWRKASEPDIKDQWIADLREQCASKDIRIRELESQLLAVTKPAAYRQIHAPETEGTEVVDLNPRQPILSPRQIPAYELKDEKLFEGIEARMRKAWDKEPS